MALAGSEHRGQGRPAELQRTGRRTAQPSPPWPELERVLRNCGWDCDRAAFLLRPRFTAKRWPWEGGENAVGLSPSRMRKEIHPSWRVGYCLLNAFVHLSIPNRLNFLPLSTETHSVPGWPGTGCVTQTGPEFCGNSPASASCVLGLQV